MQYLFVEVIGIISFTDHLNNHTHEEGFVMAIKCPYCKTKFEKRELLHNHMKDNHNAEIDAIDLRSEGPISLNPDYNKRSENASSLPILQ